MKQLTSKRFKICIVFKLSFDFLIHLVTNAFFQINAFQKATKFACKEENIEKKILDY